MKALMGHHGLRGDLVINLPAMQYLWEQAGWVIDMPIHRQFMDMAPLFLNLPYVNSVVITDSYDHFPSPLDEALLRARGYDRILSPMVQHFRDDWHQHCHQTDCVLRDYTGLTLPENRQQIQLVNWFNPGMKPDKTAVSFAPFAGFIHNKANDKMLTVERAQAIVDFLVSMGKSVIQLSGPGEPRLKGVMEHRHESYFDAVRDMLYSSLLIHTDTGMGWVASGYQHPQLGLYGHRYYGAAKVGNIQPRNPNARYLDAPTVNEIPLDSILQACQDMLASPSP